MEGYRCQELYLVIQNRKTISWILAPFHHLLSDMQRQFSILSAWASCYAVIGCIPFFEQWQAAS